MDSYSQVYDISGNFVAGSDGIYAISKTFNNAIASTDVILVYRLKETVNGQAVWQLIPRTLFLTQGELDYDYDFTRNDIRIMAGGNFNVSTVPQYLNGQTFRVVFVPTTAGKNASVNYDDYNSVIRFYNIADRQVPKL